MKRQAEGLVTEFESRTVLLRYNKSCSHDKGWNQAASSWRMRDYHYRQLHSVSDRHTDMPSRSAGLARGANAGRSEVNKPDCLLVATSRSLNCLPGCLQMLVWNAFCIPLGLNSSSNSMITAKTHQAGRWSRQPKPSPTH